MEISTKSCLFLGGVPLFYYLFDYTTTIYTDVLYRGTKWAVQFMPSTVSVFYFVFVILYCAETQKQATLQRERDMLDTQFRLAQSEFASLWQMQQNAAAYRHDMRHHFSLLQGLASEARIEEINEYLRIAQSDIDTPSSVPSYQMPWKMPYMLQNNFLTKVTASSAFVCIPKITSCALTSATTIRLNPFFIRDCLCQKSRGMALVQRVWFIS